MGVNTYLKRKEGIDKGSWWHGGSCKPRKRSEEIVCRKWLVNSCAALVSFFN